MVSVPDVKKRIEQSRNVSTKQDRRNACFVRLKCEGNDVTHQAHVVANVLRQSVIRASHLDDGLAPMLRPFQCFVLMFAQSFNPFFDLADTGEVLVQFGPISGTGLSAETCRVFFHSVKHAFVSPSATVVEQTVERQRRINFHWDRRRRVLPGNMRAVCHRKVGFVVSGNRLLATKHHARLSSLLTKMIGQNLVDAYPASQLGPLLKRSSRKNVARLPRMNANIGGILIKQPRNHVHFFFQRLEGCQTLAELHFRPGPFRPPVIRMNSARHEESPEPLRKRIRDRVIRRRKAPSRNRLEPRQGHRHAGSSKQRATRDLTTVGIE